MTSIALILKSTNIPLLYVYISSNVDISHFNHSFVCVFKGGVAAKGYLQQKSRLHYQGDMGLFLILVDCSNPFDVLSPPRQKEGYIEMLNVPY